MDMEHVMVDELQQNCRYFVSYSGVDLPFRLVNPIAADALSNRNTFIRAYFDRSGLFTGFDKVVYGEVELAHRDMNIAATAPCGAPRSSCLTRSRPCCAS